MLAHHRHRATSPSARTTWLLVVSVAVASVAPSLILINITAGLATPAASSAQEDRPEGSRAEPSPSAEVTPAPTPTENAATGPLSPDVARSTLAGFLEEAASVTAKPESFDADKIDATLQATATGAILEELHNEQLELTANGWSKRGSERIVSLTVAETADPQAQAITVSACIDSSDVVLLDADGEPIVSGTPADQRRAINIYTLQRVGDSWLISDRTFPDQAAC